MPQPMTQFQVRVPAEIHQALKEQAKGQDRSVNWLVSRILADATKKLQEANHAKS